MADQAACSAATTQPLLAKSAGRDDSAASRRLDHRSRRPDSMWRSPIRTSSSPVRTACRIALHHSTQASPASGSKWVSSLSARAAATRASSSPSPR